MDGVMQSRSPATCKRIMNNLKDSKNQKAWEAQRKDILYTSLWEKFSENPGLKEYLTNTGSVKLGEACMDRVWGIGKTLDELDAFVYKQWASNYKEKPS